MCLFMSGNIKRAIIDEIYSPARVRFPRRRTRIKSLGETLQSDLISLIQLKKHNNGFSYILVTIDTFSKFVLARALKSKSAKHVVPAFQSIFNSYKYINKTRFLCTDEGTEFYSKEMQQLLHKYNITLFSTFSKVKGMFSPTHSPTHS